MSEAKGSSGQPGPVTDPSSVEMAADMEELTALEKIVIDTRKFEDEDEDEEEGTVVTESVVSQEREVMPPLAVGSAIASACPRGAHAQAGEAAHETEPVLSCCTS